MTKKHFIKFAEQIKILLSSGEFNKGQTAKMADVVCQVAKNDNPNFDRARFLKACGLE